MPKDKLFHEPVLKDEIIALLVFDKAKTIFDGTLGLGGHAKAILDAFPGLQLYIGTDLDKQHLAFATDRLQEYKDKIQLVHSSFSSLREYLQLAPTPRVILLDLGLCSNQIDDPEKGFAFASDGPLHMCFDTTSRRNAEDFINSASLEELTRVFREYGEEPSAYKIAKKIVEVREQKALSRTGELKEIIESCVHFKQQKKTLVRVFQAIRIEVNDELEVLTQTLQDALELMTPGDRIGVISYHSLEDRIVKKIFTAASKPKTESTTLSLHEVVEEAKFRPLSKKPIVPTPEEIEKNNRARSAKLRILERI